MDGRIVALLVEIAIGTLPGWLLARCRTVESRARAGACRRAAHAGLTTQVDYVRKGSDRLREQTQSLVTALRRPEAAHPHERAAAHGTASGETRDTAPGNGTTSPPKVTHYQL